MRTASLALLAVVAAASVAAAAPTVAGVPLPRRSRTLDDSGLHFSSGRGFRKTVVHFRRHFRRRGVKVKEIPTYGYRGVIVARFLAEGPSPWAAVHVFRVGGKTHIYVVPAPPSRNPTKSAPPAGAKTLDLPPATG